MLFQDRILRHTSPPMVKKGTVNAENLKLKNCKTRVLKV